MTLTVGKIISSAANGTKEKRGLWPVSGVNRALASTLYRQKLTQPGHNKVNRALGELDDPAVSTR